MGFCIDLRNGYRKPDGSESKDGHRGTPVHLCDLPGGAQSCSQVKDRCLPRRWTSLSAPSIDATDWNGTWRGLGFSTHRWRHRSWAGRLDRPGMSRRSSRHLRCPRRCTRRSWTPWGSGGSPRRPSPWTCWSHPWTSPGSAPGRKPSSGCSSGTCSHSSLRSGAGTPGAPCLPPPPRWHSPPRSPPLFRPQKQNNISKLPAAISKPWKDELLHRLPDSFVAEYSREDSHWSLQRNV